MDWSGVTQKKLLVSGTDNFIDVFISYLSTGTFIDHKFKIETFKDVIGMSNEFMKVISPDILWSILSNRSLFKIIKVYN